LVEESVAVFSAFAGGPQVVIGSVHGRLAGAFAHVRAQRSSIGHAAGLVPTVPAVDFTGGADVEAVLAQSSSRLSRPAPGFVLAIFRSAYPITKKLIEDGRNHLCSAA
jgi:hypothetical protein